MTGATRLARTSVLTLLLIGVLSPVPTLAAGPPWYFYNQCTSGGRYDYQIHVSGTIVPSNGIWWVSTVDTIDGDKVYGSTPAGAPGPCGYPKFQGTNATHPDDLQGLMQGVPDGNYVVADNNSVSTDGYDPSLGYGNPAYYFFHIKNGLVYMDGEPNGTTTVTTTPPPPPVHNAVVWASTSAQPNELRVYTPSFPNPWFGGTAMNPSVKLGVWDKPDFTATASTTVHIWSRWNGSTSNILDVTLRTSKGGDPFFGTGYATTTAEFITPSNDSYYRLGVTATSTLQEYVIPTRVGETLHQGDEVWVLLIPSYSAYGADHWVGSNGAIPYMEICEGACDASTTPPAPTGPSSVLFLPGIESSRLYEGNDVPLWEPAGVFRPTGDLALDSAGASVGQDIYTKDVIDEAYGHGPNIYKTFLSTLETLKNDPNGIKDYEAIPYDWRLSLQDNIAYGNKIGDKLYYSGTKRATSTPYLIQELKKLATESKSGKVTIVAHSNGGLLSKELLIEHPELNALVDKIIFVDVPQVGTPEAFGALMHGENQGIPLDLTPFLFTKQQARTLSNNMPMTYNLLPSQGYFAYVDDAIATIDPATLPDWITQYGDSIHSNDRLNAFVNNSTLDKVLPSSSDTIRPTIANAGLLSNAQTLHASLDDWQPAPTTKLIQIAGWGVPTAKSISYKKKLVCVQTGGNCVPQYVLDYEMKDTIDGDGTVVTPSQLWTDAHLPNVKNYFLDLGLYNRTERPIANRLNLANNHKDVLEVPDVLSFLRDTLVETQSVHPYITQTAPLSTDSRRLKYSLHSPLTLNLYDSQGRHTGISTTSGEIEEQIPGTYYMEFGDVKYLFTDASSSAHIQMSGYATSTFTFNVDQLQGDTLLASTTFKDIPVTPATQVNLDVVSDISTLSPMHVDLGDGVVHAITPKTNGVATLDLIPPEITLAFSTSTNTLVPTATDESGTPTLTTETVYPILKRNQTGTATTTLTAIDSSGNTTAFVYTFKYPTKDRRIAVMPVSLTYNGKVTKLTNTSAKYKWNLAADLSYKMLASYIQTVNTSTESHFRPKKNVTIIMTKPVDLDDGENDDEVDTRATRSKFSGLVIPSLSTKQGKILVSY